MKRNDSSPALFTYIGNGNINSSSSEGSNEDNTEERSSLLADSPGLFYEDFASKFRTAECPTCRGTGKMTKDQVADLVALIPAADQRLKPRRTILYLAIAIFLCFTVSGLTMFFLYPRAIELKLGDLTVTKIDITNNQTIIPTITVKNTVNVTNHNFLDVSISSWVIDITWDNYAVAGQVKVGHSITVPSLKTKSYSHYHCLKYDSNNNISCYHLIYRQGRRKVEENVLRRPLGVQYANDYQDYRRGILHGTS